MEYFPEADRRCAGVVGAIGGHVLDVAGVADAKVL